MLAKTRRRWFQFSLRGLLLLILVVAALLWAVNKARQQSIAVAELGKMSCRVLYDHAESGWPAAMERLRKLMGEDEPRTATIVYARGLGITDAALTQIGALTQLQAPYLAGSEVSDAG